MPTDLPHPSMSVLGANAGATPASVPVVLPQSSQSKQPTTFGTSTAKPAKAPISRDTTEIWEVPFDRLDMWQSVDAIEKLIERCQPSYVITANLNYCMLNEQNAALRAVTQDADLVLADGHPIVMRSKLSGKPLLERVAGSELISHLCGRAAQRGWRVYFLGGEESVAQRCAARLQAMHPNLQVAGTESPPFRELSEQEQSEQDARIRDAGTDLLLVAFGQPKGEQWIHANYKRLGVPVSIQLGASFDFLAGTATRAPKIFQSVGMEWAFRMGSDPKRLVPRYFGNAVYLVKALARDWRRTVTQWGMGDWEPQAKPSR